MNPVLRQKQFLNANMINKYPKSVIRNMSLNPMELMFSKGASKKHNERRLFKHPSEHVFNVVANVNDYKLFVPWCKDSRVLVRHNSNAFDAELNVGFEMFTEKYVSNVILHNNNDKSNISKIEILSKDTAVLEHLSSVWAFSPVKDDDSMCIVDFEVSFKFKSSLYDSVSDLFMTQVAQQMVNAFEKRCQIVAIRNMK